jgi:REP element-mobilizing transposase RayT
VPFPRRKNIRLPAAVYEQENLVFSITICTAKRQRFFHDASLATQILEALKSGVMAHEARVYAYCLMPDHLHVLLATSSGNLAEIIGRWKKFTGNLLRKNGMQGPFWQRGFYDHGLRKDEDVIKTAEYIVMNPVRVGLVERWEDYPFSWHRWMEGRP